MSERYQITNEAPVTRFLMWAVIDTQTPSGHDEFVCDSWKREHAEQIAQALNAQDAARKRLEVGPAVVYRDGKENAACVTDEGKARHPDGRLMTETEWRDASAKGLAELESKGKVT